MEKFTDFNLFYLAVKRLTITKNSVMKIQNNFMNHKSQPIKLNPEYGCELYKKLPEDGKEIFVEYKKKI